MLRRGSRWRGVLIVVIAIAVTAGAVYWDAYCFEPHHPRLYRVSVELSRLPDAFDGMTLAVVSDLHIVRAGARERRMVALIERAAPNVIVGVGDYIDDDGVSPRPYTNESCAEELGEVLRQLPTEPVKVACLGNWDFEPVPDVMRQAGFRLVDDGPQPVRRESQVVTFVAPRDLEEVRQPGTAIVLSHIPEAADGAAKLGADLVLGGHWHGGQVCLPFVGSLGAETAKYPLGLYEIGDTMLYVTRGVGYHSEAVRFFCRSEVTLLTLRRSE